MNRILDDVERYYTQKLLEHGPTPRGTDWNSEESQKLRFQQLIKVLQTEDSFSILDYGCGYGALYPYLVEHFQAFRYTGYDISPQMIDSAVHLHGAKSGNHIWTKEAQELVPNDYVIASGIFNVKLEYDDRTWDEYVLETLRTLNQLSTKGFSFNMLTTYSDQEYMRRDLFYGNPAHFFDYCKRNFSPAVSLLHDYPLYEFTILVRKEA